MVLDAASVDPCRPLTGSSGASTVTAAGRTVGTSGRSVLIAATTVVIALSGLFVTRIGFIGKMGVAASIAVVVGIAAITLVPALLGLIGRRIDRFKVRHPVAEQSADGSASVWFRYARALDRHSWRYLIVGLVIALVLAVTARVITPVGPTPS